MTTTVTLETTEDDLHILHKAADTRKATVRVSREALTRLLGDNARLCAAIGGSTSFKLIEPVRVRIRQKR